MTNPSHPPNERQPVVSLSEVSKEYTVWSDPAERILAPFRRLWSRKPPSSVQRFTAVKNLSLDIMPGECLGIVGRNGAGKSTLLQMIAGTLRPSTGEVRVTGRVAALLELGSGFNPDFTGRENIHLYASIMGLTKDEIDAKYDAIAEYAGVGDFINSPVRTYSTGMAVRLAFAVCVHVDADVLIIDEALAVGDARFQFKCHATLEQMQAEGRTIIFVSHDTNAVKRMCRTAILLERGEVLLKGSPNEVVNLYTKLITSPHGVEGIRSDIKEAARSAAAREGGRAKGEAAEGGGGRMPDDGRQVAEGPASPGDGFQRAQGGGLMVENTGRITAVASQQHSGGNLGVDQAGDAGRLLAEERAHLQVSDKEYAYGGDAGKITRVQMADDQGRHRLTFVAGSLIRVQFSCEAVEAVQDPIYAVTLKDLRGQEIFGTNTFFQDIAPPSLESGARVDVSFDIQLNAQPGVYFLSVGWVRIVEGEVQVIHRRYDVLRFDVMPRDRSFGLAYCPTRIHVSPPVG